MKFTKYMKNKFLIILGILLILSGIGEFFRANKEVGGFNVGAFLGICCIWLFSYWLIRLGLGKKGLIDKRN